MAKNVITKEHQIEAKRLKAIYKAKARSLGLTQEKIGVALGGSGQSTAGNYLSGITALNLKAALIFAKELEVEISEFSPRLAALIGSDAIRSDGDIDQEILSLYDSLNPEKKVQALKLLRVLAE
jgi:transcriptional regulator with XRE-family HTH domain